MIHVPDVRATMELAPAVGFALIINQRGQWIIDFEMLLR
jgi:hypothetical protein